MRQYIVIGDPGGVGLPVHVHVHGDVHGDVYGTGATRIVTESKACI